MNRYPLRRGTAEHVMVEYTDAAGDRSLRKVMPTALIIGDGPRTPDRIYLQARCTVAKGPRSFRLDRVQALSDPSTGEIFSPSEWAATQALGDGRPFSWADADEGEPGAIPEPAVIEAGAPRWRVARAVLISLLIGYIVGRLRLLQGLLHLFGVHQGRWL